MLGLTSLSVVLLAISNVRSEYTELDPTLHSELLLQGRPQVPLYRSLLRDAQKQVETERGLVQPHNQQPLVAKHRYEAHCFPQKISHIDSSVNGTFCQRYWMDASSYEAGGPIYLLDGGETSGANRLQFLDNGILQILSNATHGLSIVLEHRYYGKSVPVESLSTDDLRFLNNAEALEDSAYFIENFKPPKSLLPLIDTATLHPSQSPWFYYGGSYAGARAAHMRSQYPHLVWGAIASSAVTHAQVNFPQYHDAIIKYGPEKCIDTLLSAITTIDKALDLPEPIPSLLKGLFGLEGLKDNADFGEVISGPLGYWQAKNWDPKVGSEKFYDFCDALTGDASSVDQNIDSLIAEIAGVAVMNYGKYVKKNIVERCPAGENGTRDVEECFGSGDDEKFQDTDLSQVWRLWLFQVCTQWGYFMPAPLEGPSIVSRHVTLEHTSKICKQAYPPGKHFTVPQWPDVDEVNRRGDFALEYSRLAYIDGDRDPWRYCTPQSDVAPRRQSTVDKPMHLIFDGVHHYDENGLTNHLKEPSRIRDVHAFEIDFITEWVAQFKEAKGKK